MSMNAKHNVAALEYRLLRPIRFWTPVDKTNINYKLLTQPSIKSVITPLYQAMRFAFSFTHVMYLIITFGADLKNL